MTNAMSAPLAGIVKWPAAAAETVWNIYAEGGRALIAAPAIAALVVVPEAVQHVVELMLGMFESHAALVAHAADPLRMGIGYVKIGGVALAALGYARFAALGSVSAALLPAWRTVVSTILAVVVFQAIGYGLQAVRDGLGDHPLGMAVVALNFAAQFVVLLAILAIVLEDRSVPLWRAALRWRSLLAMVVLGAVAYMPAQALHGLNHQLAVVTPTAVDLALMLFDSLLVGLMAALAGVALAKGYRIGAAYSADSEPSMSARLSASRFHISA